MNAALLISALWCASLPAGSALAQAGAGGAQPPAGAQAAPPAVSAPFQPEVSDPMLTPVPGAPVQLGSWDEALGMLRQRSTDLRIALAQVESALGQRRVSLAALLPSLTGSVSVQSNVLNPSATFIGGIGTGTAGTGITTTSPLGLGVLTANVPLVDLAALQTLRASNASTRAANLSLEETRRQLTLSLARALVQVATNERLAEVNRLNLRTSLERLALAQRRLELGAGTRLDVVRLQQDAETARTSLVSGDESLRQSRDTLGLVLGLERPVGLASGLDMDALLGQSQKQCKRLQGLEDRPDLAASRARLDAAGLSVTAARSRYLPTLAATSTVDALTVNPGFARVPIWNIGATLTLPFYEGGAREGLVRQARAQEDIAQQNLTALRRTATVEVERTRREVEVARSEQAIASRAHELAAENDRLTRRAFEVGTGTSQDLVVSAAALRQAELELVVRDFQLLQARIEAFLAEAACDW